MCLWLQCSSFGLLFTTCLCFWSHANTDRYTDRVRRMVVPKLPPSLVHLFRRSSRQFLRHFLRQKHHQLSAHCGMSVHWPSCKLKLASAGCPGRLGSESHAVTCGSLRLVHWSTYHLSNETSTTVCTYLESYIDLFRPCQSTWNSNSWTACSPNR
ncbi:hypothetical protein X801_03052 [Opisthorchis viverrini]|uniref:Secreted protein n=1 Tax=Opisthorchis viverrini TaxID=6198 RepID=A0A1S8X2V1_OPIVI|nr:hypothetical protein X801_03052 [Opisthorchis viverrini]